MYEDRAIILYYNLFIRRRIRNSDINCAKVKMLLKALAKNDCLRELEFSHCKIADHGTMAIAKFAQEHVNLKYLMLINNFIGMYQDLLYY